MKKNIGIIIVGILILSGIGFPTQTAMQTPSIQDDYNNIINNIIKTSFSSKKYMEKDYIKIDDASISSTGSNIKILIIMAENYGFRYFEYKDIFDLLGWDVTVTGLHPTVPPCSFSENQIKIHPLDVDVLVSDITDISMYDCIHIDSASGRSSTSDPCHELIENNHVLELISSANNAGKIISARCYGVRVLAAAGILDGKHVTGAAAYKDEYEAAGAIYMGAPIPPVTDGNIVTQNSQFYLYKQNCDAIAAAIEKNKNSVHDISLKEINCDEIEITSYQSDENRWMKIIGGSDSDGAWSICKTIDNEYVVVGYTFSFGSGMSDVFLCKIDQNGEVVWSKAIGGSGFEVGYDICETSDHGFLISGYTTSLGAGSRDVLVIKTNHDGEILWQKTFGGADIDIGFSTYETSNHCYVVTGSTKSYGNHSDDVYTLMMDQNGNLLWDDVWNNNEPVWGNDVIETDEGIILVLTTVGDLFRLPDWYDRDTLFLLYEKDGTYIGNKTVPETPGSSWNSFNCGEKIINDHDGGFAIAGWGNILENDAGEVYFLKTDGTGEKLFDKRYGENRFFSFGRSLCLADQGYTICGYDITLLDNYETDVYLLNVDNNGNLVWKQLCGGLGSNWGLDICEGADNGFIVVGQTKSISDNSYDIMIIKTDEDGMVSNLPDTPDPPVGPSRGASGKPHIFKASTNEIDGDLVCYLFDWGDESNSGWLGPFASGEICEASHIWGLEGDYEIKVKAKDIYGYASEWSEPVSISIPKNKSYMISSIFSKLLNDHQNLLQLIGQIL